MGGKREHDVLGLDAPFAGHELSEDETGNPVGMSGGAPRIARVRKDWDESELVTTPAWEVAGKTVEDVRAALDELGAEWGKGGGEFYAKFVDEEDKSVTAVVTAQFTKILPTWVDEDDGDADAKARWETMIEALDKHEQRHVDIAVEAATAFADELPGTLCSGIVRRHKDATTKMQAAQLKLDSPAESDHGRKPGHEYGGVDY